MVASQVPDRVTGVPLGRATAWRPRQARIDFKLGLVYALLWAVAVTALESFEAVFYTPPGATTFGVVAALLMMWTSRGLALAWTAQAVEGGLSARRIVAVFVVEVLLLSLAWDGVTELSMLGERLGLPLPVRANFLYNMWVLVVYGGALFWFCLAGQRARRTRDVLARAEIERNRSAAMLNEAQLDALKGRVDPELLFRALSALRGMRDPERAEALLDAFVGFLRHAMPGVRSGRSSVLTELALLRAYARLMQELDPGRRLCRIRADAVLHDRPFPRLLLVPLVEHLQAAQAPDAAPLSVELTADAAGLKLVLAGATERADWLKEDLRQRLQQTLQALYGDEGRWMAGGTPSLTLWLPLATTEPKGS